MMRSLCVPLFFLLLTLTASAQPAAQRSFVFRDAGDDAGLFPSIGGIRGHGAAWGDIDGSGYPALFVNSFHDNGSKAGRGLAALDADGDGLLDLILCE